jgi:hypothetical protein
MSAIKTLSVLSELDVHMSITKNGIGVTISSGQDCETSFSEYTWDELIDDTVEAHTIPVLKENDYRLSRDSFNKAQKMRREAEDLDKRIEGMGILGGGSLN